MNEQQEVLSKMMRMPGAVLVFRQFFVDSEVDPFVPGDQHATAYRCGARKRAAQFLSSMAAADPEAYRHLWTLIHQPA